MKRRKNCECCLGHSLICIVDPYLIFVISFTQAGFSKTKFYTQKTTKGTKNTKNVCEKRQDFRKPNFTPKKRLRAPKTLKMSVKKVKYMHF